MAEHLLDIIYLIASASFIIGLKKLSHPESARKGNTMAAIGMGLAMIATIFLHQNEEGSYVGNYEWIFGGMLLGGAIGWITAKKVKMTAMPEMVSLFNGMGGACVALISLIEFPHFINESLGITIVLCGLVIGTVSFSGSMIAFSKLNGILKKDIRIRFYNIINSLVLLTIIGLTTCIIMHNISDVRTWVYILFGIAIIYGILFVIPIGGADMPVVISLLNSFTGMGAAFAGFMYDNMAMLTGGILVGSAGTILTVNMCLAMNRSLVNVIFGAFGSGGKTTSGGAGSGDKGVKEISVSDAAILMNYSGKVVIVPGYGLAVAQAQHAIHEFENMLEKNGVEVRYAIHPVAGRMPGHMNVLLAEANIPYEKLIEMDDINPMLPNTDVVIVVGANDVVNPAALNDPSSPIYGMPILNVHEAAHIVIIKRSMSAGYAGIDNALFYNEKTSMLFGDAKKVINDLLNELKGM